jgi:hypothetical protein
MNVNIPDLTVYSPLTDTYILVWKTNKVWANSCSQLVVKLNNSNFRLLHC